jgi:hypothetical protein
LALTISCIELLRGESEGGDTVEPGLEEALFAVKKREEKMG